MGWRKNSKKPLAPWRKTGNFFLVGRGSQVVRRGSAKAVCVGSIPTLASNSKLLKSNELQTPEEASASESASEISTAVKLKYYPGITRPSLATTGFAARLV